jgi:hypothetical protein
MISLPIMLLLIIVLFAVWAGFLLGVYTARRDSYRREVDESRERGPRW